MRHFQKNNHSKNWGVAVRVGEILGQFIFWKSLSKFEALVTRHEELLELQKEQDIAEKAQIYIEQVIAASSQIAAPHKRDQLRANLRYWAGYVYDKKGVYPSIELAPPSRLASRNWRLRKTVTRAFLTVILLMLILTLLGVGVSIRQFLLVSVLPTYTPTLTPSPPPTETPTVTVMPTPTATATPSPMVFPGYDWESCNTEGAVVQTYEDSQGIESVESSDKIARTGSCSLKLNARLHAHHPNFSKGEVYVQLPTPVDLQDVKIDCWVYVPNPSATGPKDAPNGAQLFVKDLSFKSEYGSWVNLVHPGWFRVTLTPGTSAPLFGGYMDFGFDPSAVLILGVKIGTNDQADASYSYIESFYVDSCTLEPA